MRIKAKGFSLIELMITLVIVSIIAAIAYPSYSQYLAKGTRSEALAAIMNIANLQEQFYLDNKAYTSDMTDLGFAVDPLVTERGHYSLDTRVSGFSYTIIATALGAQANRDLDCATLTLTSEGIKNKPECW